MKTEKEIQKELKGLKLSAGNIAVRGTKDHSSGYRSVSTIDPHHHNCEARIIDRFFIRCQVKCDLQEMGFCLCMTGRCFKEENEPNFIGAEERTILRVR